MASCGIRFDGLDGENEMVACGAVFRVGIAVEGDRIDKAIAGSAISRDVALVVIVAVVFENPAGSVGEINDGH